MKVGSTVVTVGDFSVVRATWGFPYPKIDDVLTVATAIPHTNKDCRANGIILLTFEELPHLVPVCHKTMSGNLNFEELVMPKGLEEALNINIKKSS